MSTIKGFIDDGIGNISEVTLRVPQNTDQQKTLTAIEDLKRVNVLNNRYKTNDQMIIGRMWHAKYPVGYTRFLDELQTINTKIETTYGKTAFLDWLKDNNVKIKYDETKGELYDVETGETTIDDKDIVLCRGNFQINQTDLPIVVSKTIYLIDANLFLNGCQLWLCGDAKLMCSGNTNVFGGTIRYFNANAPVNTSFIRLLNFEDGVKSSFNFVGLGITIELTYEKYKRVHVDSATNLLLKGGTTLFDVTIFNCFADYSKIVIDHCNLVLQCDENTFTIPNIPTGTNKLTRTIGLFADIGITNWDENNLKGKHFSYLVELKNSYIYGQYWHNDTIVVDNDKEDYGISLIYAYGNINIQNCTFDLDGVDAITTVNTATYRRSESWDVPNHRHVNIIDSEFNILDMTKLFVPSHELFVLENTSINVGTVRNLNDSTSKIKNHVPCLIELNKDPYITTNFKQEHIILKDVKLNGTIQTKQIDNHSNGFIIRNRTTCNDSGTNKFACNIEIMYNDKTSRIGSDNNGKLVKAQESADGDGTTWYIEKDPVESVKTNTNVLVVKNIKYYTNKFVFE
jgi:hypothetical protein